MSLNSRRIKCKKRANLQLCVWWHNYRVHQPTSPRGLAYLLITSNQSSRDKTLSLHNYTQIVITIFTRLIINSFTQPLTSRRIIANIKRKVNKTSRLLLLSFLLFRLVLGCLRGCCILNDWIKCNCFVFAFCNLILEWVRLPEDKMRSLKR